jgi:hypothetical protein
MEIDIDKALASIMPWDLQIKFMGQIYNIAPPSLIDAAFLQSFAAKDAAAIKADPAGAMGQLREIIERLLGEAIPASATLDHLCGIAMAIFKYWASLPKNLSGISAAIDALMPQITETRPTETQPGKSTPR